MRCDEEDASLALVMWLFHVCASGEQDIDRHMKGNSLRLSFKLFIYLYNTVSVVAEICAQNNSEFRVKKKKILGLSHWVLMYMDFTALIYLHPNTPHIQLLSPSDIRWEAASEGNGQKPKFQVRQREGKKG